LLSFIVYLFETKKTALLFDNTKKTKQMFFCTPKIKKPPHLIAFIKKNFAQH